MRPSATRNGPGDWADNNAPDRRSIFGNIRRMVVKLTSKALWQLVGHTLPDGRPETRNADVFSGVGFYSRPKSTDRAEAIVLFPGVDAGAPVVVATRNEDARKAIEAVLNAGAGLAAGETVVYGDGGLIHFKADGSIEARAPNGVAVRLATKDDLDVLRAAINAAIISLGAGGAATIVTAMDVALAARIPPTGPWPNGTSKLKGQ